MHELSEAALDTPSAALFFAMLAESRRPLIYAGGGVINGNAASALTEFATTFGVPVVTTLMGIGALDTTHALSLRMLGMHGAAFANYAVDDCDFLIAVGARFDDRVAGVPAKFAGNARHIAHLDVDRAEVNKVKRAHWSHVGLLAGALRTLTAHGRQIKFQARLQRLDGRGRRAEARLCHELRPRESADPAVLRHRGAQTATRAVKPSSPPASGSTRCGRHSTATSPHQGCG